MKCLDCGRELDGQADHMRVVSCSCGLRYGADLIADSDHRIWETVRKHRLFVRRGNDMMVSIDHICHYCGRRVTVANYHEGPEDCAAEASLLRESAHHDNPPSQGEACHTKQSPPNSPT